jgi:hypothetical protein
LRKDHLSCCPVADKTTIKALALRMNGRCQYRKYLERTVATSGLLHPNPDHLLF